MTKQRTLESVPDHELLRRLSELVAQSRRVESELVAHIAEVDERRLFASQACSSMFSYCTQVLHLSESEAYMRIAAARASRKYAVLLDMLADGRLHVSGISRLAPHLTDENWKSVLARATHKSKRQIEELIVELEPKPDVPASLRKLPERPTKPPPPSQPEQLVPERVTFLHTPAPKPEREPEDPSPSLPRPSVPSPLPPNVEPLAPARYKVQFTASAEFHDKLERLQALMRSSVPDGDLAALLEDAVTEKLEKLESRRFGKTKAPRKNLDQTDTSPSSRHIPAAVRRAVRERDGDRCTYRDGNGRRCPETRRLEFHHEKPFGLGGDHSPDNVRLACNVHNALFAERDYGKEKMARYRTNGSHLSEPPPVYYANIHAALAASALEGRAPPA
ncbi:MAG TPA: HNH endonuclease [Vicinamibacteria bacterium]|nr:HNH endonuclease [Vicinamibacteria bacterium]